MWPSYQVVCGVVQHYVDKVATHIPEYVAELETVSLNFKNWLTSGDLSISLFLCTGVHAAQQSTVSESERSSTVLTNGWRGEKLFLTLGGNSYSRSW